MLLGENKKYVKIAVTGIVISAAAIAILFLFYRFEAVSAVIARVFSILRPFLYGGVIAYLLAPLCGKLEEGFGRLFGEKRKRGAKALSILLCVLLAIALVVLLSLIIFPQLVRSVISIASALPGQLRSLSKTIDEVLAAQPDLQAQWDNISNQVSTEIEKWTSTDILPLAQSILAGTASYVSSFVIFLQDVLLGIVIAIYLLAQRRQIADQTRLLVYTVFSDHWSTLIESETHYIDRMFNSFITGKLLDSAIVGVLCFIGCVIFGFSSPVLISVIVGVTNIIPFFGPFLGAIPCALLLLLSNPVHCLIFLIFILVLQQLDGNVIGPRILGNTTGLSGFWVTFAIILFGGIWGITGMIVGVPLFAVIYDLVRRVCYKFLRKKGKGELIARYQEAYHPQVERKPAARTGRKK